MTDKEALEAGVGGEALVQGLVSEEVTMSRVGKQPIPDPVRRQDNCEPMT